jgi:4-methyl-5(b-hydroxyethyl)-thiazole monophosphate biosynthesis
MPKKAIVFLADGFEEVEAITPIDYLRRAGIAVTTVSSTGEAVATGSHGIPVRADTTLAALKQGVADLDAVLLPGGMPGAKNLAACAEVGAFLKAMDGAGKLIAAICAAPAVVLAPLGLLSGRRFTCYPGMEAGVSGARWVEEPVVVDGNCITSRGAGTAARWAFAVIEQLLSRADADRVAQATLAA